MKIFYYRRPDGFSNFGDQLNPWLWKKLLPGVFDDEESKIFLGFGTLLNDLLPKRVSQAKKVAIFSTGVGYENNLGSLPEYWKIYCVRGFLSAKNLAISNETAVTDGAILIRRLFQPTGKKVTKFSFMPHVHHANFAGKVLQKICQDIGFGYIDPRWSIEKVLTAISQTEILLAEAMHGAVVADALRVSWIPVKTSSRILDFKWHDWCSSINLRYKPYYLMPLLGSYPPVTENIRFLSIKNFKLSAKAAQYWGKCLQQGLLLIGEDEQKIFAARLLKIVKIARPQLSQDDQIEGLTMELEARLEKFKNDNFFFDR
ncbi:MAG: polysaccharide pyruvyl transferase family protein [Microcoleaceae cyanobacterium MO_207.B10]|nr:polysaccharide pyruvyl transferase family protein [Microcoleaceae cyanobacterium MO_207.B10]